MTIDDELKDFRTSLLTRSQKARKWGLAGLAVAALSIGGMYIISTDALWASELRSILGLSLTLILLLTGPLGAASLGWGILAQYELRRAEKSLLSRTNREL